MTRSGTHSLATKLLHGALALAVTCQLAFVGLVERPRNGVPGNIFYQFHEVVGLTTLAVVGASWIWIVVRRGETRATTMFPWSSSERVRTLLADVDRHWAVLRQFKLPESADTPLASAVHGLGLLTVTAMAVTGATFALAGLPKAQAGLVLQVHKVVANLMWAYFIGHAGLAMLHQLAGQPILKRIFGRGAS
jgi:cytochrome b561